MDPSWLRLRIHPPESAPEGEPSGAIGDEPMLVAELLEALEPSQELWYFESPPETWNSLCGRAGYAVVEDGKIVDAHITILN